MKTKSKRQRQPELPRFIIGALATAGASAASGATVQITLGNTYLGADTTSTSLDITGDGTREGYLNGAENSIQFTWTDPVDPSMTWLGARAIGTSGGLGQLEFNSAFFQSAIAPATLTGRQLISLIFRDTRINHGESTAGWLDVTATAKTGAGSFTELQIHRLIFSDASTTAPPGVAYTDGAYTEWQVSAVPEPGSNLALLALGAGGLTLRRRLKRAA